ncbi:tail spike protein [Pantoea phage PA-1]
MSISDTRDAAKYASIAEVAAAQAKTYADKLDSAPDYASQAAASAADAAQSATVAVAAESTVNNYVIAASQYASQAEASAQTAGSAAESAVGRTLRVPESTGINALPASADRQSSVVSFDSSGNAAVKPLADFAILDSNGKIPVENIPAIALTEPFVVSSQAAMLALNAQVGDIAKRTDKGYSFVLAQLPASTLANWVQLNDDILAQLSQSGGAAQIGAVGKASATTNVQALLDQKTYASDLSAVTGSSLVGYQNPSSSVSELVKNSLDKLNVRLIYAADFGVKTDSSDNADALWNLGQFISNATVPLYVIFPKGVSLVGSQQFAGATGQGYSYRPSYFSRAWGDASDMGWFSVHRTNNNITLDMSGWTLKMNSGMRHGSFDPVTGSVYNPSSLPFRNFDYQASQGYLCKIYKAPNTLVLNGTTDFSVSTVVWGGNFGDAGYQAASYNWWINQSSGFVMIGHTAQSSAMDGLYVGESGDSFSPGDTTQIKGSYFKGCVLQDCGRNILSYTGGANAVFEDCEFWRAGNNATGIGGHGSGPASCIDVEAEGGKILNLKFHRCKMMHGGDVSVVGGYAQPYDVTGVVFEDCIMHCQTGTQAFINYARNCLLKNCIVYGGISLDTGTKQDPTKVINCTFYNRVDGTYITNFALSGITNQFENCTVFYEIPSAALPDMVIFNLSGYQPLSGGYGGMAKMKNLRVILSGNSNNITHSDMGGFSYFSDCSIMVEADGVTGSKNLGIYMLDSRPSMDGLAVSGSSLVNFGGAMVNQPGTSIYWDSANRIPAPATISPQIDGAEGLGVRGVEFSRLYSKAGVFTRSPNGTLYQLSVNDSGSLIVTNIP